MITFSPLINPPPEIITLIKAYEPHLKNKDISSLVAPMEVWNFLVDDLKKPESEREVNGCGSKSTEAVPDTMWLLRVTIVCHIHDVMFKFSETPADCDLSNILFLDNLIYFINDNSSRLTAWLRRYRAVTYYGTVHEYKKEFCPGYNKRKTDHD